MAAAASARRRGSMPEKLAPRAATRLGGFFASPQLGDRHAAAAGLRLGLAILDAVGAGGEELLYRATERSRADAVDDSDLGAPRAHRAIEEGSQRRHGVACALPHQVDLARRGLDVGAVHLDGDPIAWRGLLLYDPQLGRRHLELEPAARDARALWAELQHLAADAPPHTLDGVAEAWRPAKRRRRRRRGVGLVWGDPLRRRRNERPQHCRLRPATQLLEHGA